MLSAYSSEHFWTDAFELWKFFFQEHLILDIKTTFRLQKPYFENFWCKHIESESYKWYLVNKEQKAMLLVILIWRAIWFRAHSFLRARSSA